MSIRLNKKKSMFCIFCLLKSYEHKNKHKCRLILFILLRSQIMLKTFKLCLFQIIVLCTTSLQLTFNDFSKIIYFFLTMFNKCLILTLKVINLELHIALLKHCSIIIFTSYIARNISDCFRQAAIPPNYKKFNAVTFIRFQIRNFKLISKLFVFELNQLKINFY